MRARPVLLVPLAAALLWPASSISAQAVDRTDTPRRGALRVSFDPETMTWERNITPAGRQPIGAAFAGDSLTEWQPSVALAQQQVRAATGLAGYLASLGGSLLAVRAERRVMPIGFEYGLTSRLSLSVTIPIVRVNVREGFRAKPSGSNLGALPDPSSYSPFFAALGTALQQLSDSINAATSYGCPAGPACLRAMALRDKLRADSVLLFDAVHDSLARFLPVAGSDAGRSLTAMIEGMQRALVDTFHISAFDRDSFLLPAVPLSGDAAASLLDTRLSALGLAPYADTPRHLRFFAGDVEVQAKLRLLARDDAAASAAFVVRLPTGHQDSPNDPFDISTGDHQTDLEGRLTGELTLLNRIWLNGSLRVARQLPGQRFRRVGPADNPFLPASTIARLQWDPGDYIAVDVAPMFRFSRRFAVGLTASYYTQGQDRYSSQDSTAVDLSVLDAGTAIHYARLGFALTYAGPRLEGGFSMQQTVSGAGGLVPVATVFRIVMRQTILLF